MKRNVEIRDKPDPQKVLETFTKIAEEEELNGEAIAQRELAQRQLARRHLIASVVRFNDDYMAGWVHKDICARLERFMHAVEAGENPRLMLQMPPRHGKSTLASQEFPAWVLGHHPDWEMIVCSYAETLALDFSRNVRERMRDKEFRVLFPDAKIDPDNQNAKGWKLTSKGGFLPAGVEGPITGKGAHILIIDDPIKNSQEADSELKRTSILKWYSSTAYTRLAPGGGVLIIQTRWHLDDLSGRLESDMKEGNGDVFEVVRYPAVAIEDEKHRKRGEPLHKERYDTTQLKMIKKAVGERTWAALYQQNPVPDEGAQFQHSMIHYYQPDELPDELTKVAAWDLAVGQKEVNDKTVGFTWGKDIVGDFWFLDCRHGHFDSLDIVDEICDSFQKHNPYTVGIEKDKVAMSVGPLLDIAIEERGLSSLHITELRPMLEGNKVKRARTLQGLMRQGKVHLPHPDTCDWVDEFVTELLQFPYGRRDDHVDSAAWLALMATDTPSPGANYSRVPKRTSWRDRLREFTRDQQRSMMGS
jgi:predicted phage terminase large subunit-like protein